MTTQQITLVGNATQDPEVRYTASGVAVASFTIAATPRVYDKASGTYKDGEALFMRCSAWRNLAENIGESVQKGTRLVVTGTLKQRSFETKTGEKRTVVELDVDEVGISLRFAPATSSRATRSESSASAPAASAAADPWSSPVGEDAPF